MFTGNLMSYPKPVFRKAPVKNWKMAHKQSVYVRIIDKKTIVESIRRGIIRVTQSKKILRPVRVVIVNFTILPGNVVAVAGHNISLVSGGFCNV